MLSSRHCTGRRRFFFFPCGSVLTVANILRKMATRIFFFFSRTRRYLFSTSFKEPSVSSSNTSHLQPPFHTIAIMRLEQAISQALRHSGKTGFTCRKVPITITVNLEYYVDYFEHVARPSLLGFLENVQEKFGHALLRKDQLHNQYCIELLVIKSAYGESTFQHHAANLALMSFAVGFLFSP